MIGLPKFEDRVAGKVRFWPQTRHHRLGLSIAPNRRFDRVEQIMQHAERVVATVVKSREPFPLKRI
jgi:hypothetical protein